MLTINFSILLTHECCSFALFNFSRLCCIAGYAYILSPMVIAACVAGSRQLFSENELDHVTPCPCVLLLV